MGIEKYSSRLGKVFKKTVGSLKNDVEKYPWSDKQAYGNWLAQTYYFVRHTTAFLGLAAARYGWERREQQYDLIGHLRDESGHDKVALSDLNNLGFELEDFPELIETSALYQTQYYWIEHQDPCAHIGYSLCLEGLATTNGDMVDKAVDMYGKETTQFIRLHAEVDQDHFQHGLERLVSLEEWQVDLVERNLVQSSELYKLMLEKAAQSAGSATSKIA